MTDLELTTESETPRPPRTYIWWAIAATAFCFAPLGVVAIFFGYRTLRWIDLDNAERAERSSRLARRWLIVTVVVGLLINLTLLVVFGLMGAFST